MTAAKTRSSSPKVSGRPAGGAPVFVTESSCVALHTAGPAGASSQGAAQGQAATAAGAAAKLGTRASRRARSARAKAGTDAVLPAKSCGGHVV
eukprot:4506718-Amphidinium_carterae.1